MCGPSVDLQRTRGTNRCYDCPSAGRLGETVVPINQQSSQAKGKQDGFRTHIVRYIHHPLLFGSLSNQGTRLAFRKASTDSCSESESAATTVSRSQSVSQSVKIINVIRAGSYTLNLVSQFERKNSPRTNFLPKSVSRRH